ncbi:MAG: hypothetical protein AAF558_02515 [Verrucomicrobiota bacterium]
MDREEAKLLLSVYRPNGKDAEDSDMQRAFSIMEKDPELEAWFRQELAMDQAISSKLDEFPVDESVKVSVLTGGKLIEPPIWWQQPVWLAAAAVLLFSIGLFFLGQFGTQVAQPVLAEFRNDTTGLIRVGFDLDMQSKTLGEIETWLMNQDAPSLGGADIPLAELSTMGCKTFEWKGRPVTLICFHGNGNDVVHLFVMDLKNEGLKHLPINNETVLAVVRDLHTATWQQDDKAYLMVGHTPQTRVTPYL